MTGVQTCALPIWFSYGDMKLGQGKENVKARLETEDELREDIEAKVMAALFPEEDEEINEDTVKKEVKMPKAPKEEEELDESNSEEE